MATEQQKAELADELRAFEAIHGELLKHHEGKVAIIKGGKLEGTFTTEREAYEAGAKAFGNATFLVRPVLRESQTAAMPALFAGLLHAPT